MWILVHNYKSLLDIVPFPIINLCFNEHQNLWTDYALCHYYRKSFLRQASPLEWPIQRKGQEWSRVRTKGFPGPLNLNFYPYPKISTFLLFFLYFLSLITIAHSPPPYFLFFLLPFLSILPIFLSHSFFHLPSPLG